jgi:hypothetical protein
VWKFEKIWLSGTLLSGNQKCDGRTNGHEDPYIPPPTLIERGYKNYQRYESGLYCLHFLAVWTKYETFYFQIFCIKKIKCTHQSKTIISWVIIILLSHDTRSIQCNILIPCPLSYSLSQLHCLKTPYRSISALTPPPLPSPFFSILFTLPSAINCIQDYYYFVLSMLQGLLFYVLLLLSSILYCSFFFKHIRVNFF